MIHKMKLNNSPFMLIKNGQKIYELRLNDEKRQLIKAKDIIEFTNQETFEKMLVEVVDLIYFPSFKELYKSIDKNNLGYKDNEEANARDMEQYYSLEEQEKYGAVAIKIKKI